MIEPKYLYEKIPDIFLFENFLSPEQEEKIIKFFDKGGWDLNSEDKRFQKYEELTGSLKVIAEHLEDNIPNGKFSSCYVEEDLQNQKSSPFCDPHSLGPLVIIISLLSPITLFFSRGSIILPVYLPPRSLLVLKDDARYLWKREIPRGRVVMTDNGILIKNKNYRRVSIKFVG